MNLNLDKIKAALDKYDNPQSATGGGKNQFGDNLLRLNPANDEISTVVKIVSNKFNLEDPFTELYFHYGLPGLQSALCPRKMHNEPCPACEFGWTVLEKYKETRIEKDRKPLDILMPNVRIFVPVVVMEEEQKKTRLWGFSPTVHRKLLSCIVEFAEEGIDITDPEKSPEFRISVISKAKSKKSFNTIDIDPVKKGLSYSITKLANKDDVAAILDSCPNVTDIYEPKTHEEISEAVDKYAQGSAPNTTTSSTEEASTGTEKDYSNDKEASGEESDSSDNLENLADKFSKAMNERESDE